MHFKSEIDKANTKYVWAFICFKIADKDGNDKDLLDEISHLTLQDVIKFSKIKWCSTDDKNTIPAKINTTFTKIHAQKRIRSTMMAGFIRNSLTIEAKRKVDQSRKNFQFKHENTGIIEEDGPIMLKIIYDRINPSTCVGVSIFKNQVR